MFLRFAAPGPLHEATHRPRGLFQIGYQALREGPLGDEELARLQQKLCWFEQRLARPARLARSQKPGAESKASVGSSRPPWSTSPMPASWRSCCVRRRSKS